MLEEKTRLAQLHSEELEIRDAFGDQKLEKWPMMPTKKVLRVTASEVFDGRVSQEFRVKDTDESSKGVSLLMGRSATTTLSRRRTLRPRRRPALPATPPTS